MGNVVITGGSRGIGAATVELFAARGERVTFLYEKNHTAAKAVADKTGAAAICCDVADGEAVNRAFSQIGDVDILVCNAGTMYFGLLSQMAEDEWNRLFAVNVGGIYHCVNAAMPSFLKTHRGSIVTVASMWGQVGASCEAAYSATKGAGIALTKALAKELRICEQRVTAAFRKLAELQLIWEKRCGRGDANQIYCAGIVPFRARILIPETEMWAENDERPAFVLRNMPGAQIDFVITHVDREAGFAIGSRRLALASRRYFFSTQPLHQPGSRVPCHVLAVGPRRCLVECYGYDVNLSQRDMSYAAIPDLREQYHPGDELTCVVKQFDRKVGTLVISVKETVPNPFDEASLRHPVGCRRRATIAGKYAGGVFCNLPDGAVVMCRYSFHYEDSDFKTGDTVMVVIQRYDEGKKQIFGKIVGR